MPDLAQFARQRLSQKAAPETHPDANLLTGFVENALIPRMRMQVTEHLADCTACRGILRLMLPQQQPVIAPQVVVEKAHTKVWSILRWASAVATTAVVAGTVWIAQAPKAIVGSSSVEHATVASASAPSTPSLVQPETSVRPAATKRRNHQVAPPTEVATSSTPE